MRGVDKMQMTINMSLRMRRNMIMQMRRIIRMQIKEKYECADEENKLLSFSVYLGGSFAVVAEK